MIKVLIAEDVHMERGALVALLGLEPDLEVVADVSPGDDILPTAQRHRPDVAVIDIDLPGRDGLSAAAELHDALPSCRTLMLTSISRPSTVRRALSMKVGGFLLKDSPPDKLASAIRQVAAGSRVVERELALSAWDCEECPLTNRELDVLRCAADGDEVAEIAAKLHLSSGTVRNYLTTIVTKLNARNRVDAVRIAAQADWL